MKLRALAPILVLLITLGVGFSVLANDTPTEPSALTSSASGALAELPDSSGEEAVSTPADDTDLGAPDLTWLSGGDCWDNYSTVALGCCSGNQKKSGLQKKHCCLTATGKQCSTQILSTWCDGTCPQ